MSDISPVTAAVAPGHDPARPDVRWADPARAARFRAWLDALVPTWDLAPETVRVASADASFRRYLRVDAPPRACSFIVMDAPPDKEPTAPFVRIARWLTQSGVRVPAVHAWDEANGFVLLEDLGDRVMIGALGVETGAFTLHDGSATRLALLRRAIDTLLPLQRAAGAEQLPPYDEALLRRELQLFPDWYLAQHKGLTLPPDRAQVLATSFDRIVARNLAAARVAVHRDFMPRNLMLLDEAPPALGVLDFQDAVYGPITYDIASLTRDAFVSWNEDFVIDVVARYWEAARKAGLPVDADFGAFYEAVEWMGLQRHLKVAGIFARLTLRDGKPRYLADTPRFMAYIHATASRYRELVPLARLVEQVEGLSVGQGWAFGRVS